MDFFVIEVLTRNQLSLVENYNLGYKKEYYLLLLLEYYWLTDYGFTNINDLLTLIIIQIFNFTIH